MNKRTSYRLLKKHVTKILHASLCGDSVNYLNDHICVEAIFLAKGGLLTHLEARGESEAQNGMDTVSRLQA